MILPLYNSLAPLTLMRRAVAAAAEDPDAAAYLDAVEVEDGQALEAEVRAAVNDFVLGCKSDGIWSAIKASCILAGARTLSGALVPLVGTAPTNNNFVSADYNRETGLKGNGSTKYLDSSRADNAEPQNSKHAAVFVQTGGESAYLGALTTDGSLDGTQLYNDNASGYFRCNSNASYATARYVSATGLVAVSRSNSTQLTYRISGSTNTVTNASAPSQNISIHIFRRNFSLLSPTAARFQFYSIGESIDLAALDARVSTLMTDLAAAIP